MTSENGTATTRQVFAYFTPLTFLSYLVLPHGYLLDFATSFMLKNQLHATTTEVSLFRLVTALPVYCSVLFGLTRDLWNPLGLRDRGYFLIFAPATAVVFLWLSFSKLTYSGLFMGMFIVMFSFRFVMAAYQGLIALIGEEKLMTGRLSALWQIVSSIPYMIGAIGAGYIAMYLPPRRTFILMAVMAIAMGLLGLWKPRSVFRGAYDQPLARGSNLVGDIKRLLRHRAVYPAVLIMFLFQFAPGSNTPLQFYLSNTLHATDTVYGYFYAIFIGAFIPVFFLYGYLCKKFSLRSLLIWGTVITVPQMIPLAFINSGTEAMWLAAPIGMLGGVAAAAYYDLAMRSCPPGLQGALMMLVDGAYLLSSRGGDVLGSWIYNSSPKYGFLYCVIATTAVYALILPTILLIPKAVMSTADGQARPEAEAKILGEIAETEPSPA